MVGGGKVSLFRRLTSKERSGDRVWPRDCFASSRTSTSSNLKLSQHGDRRVEDGDDREDKPRCDGHDYC